MKSYWHVYYPGFKTILIGCLLYLLAISSTTVIAQQNSAANEAALKESGRRTRVNEILVCKLFGQWPEGNIKKVTLRSTASNYVQVRIQYEDLDGAIVKGEILDDRKKRVKIIEATTAVLDGAPVDLDFRANYLPEDVEIGSRYLKLSVAKSDGDEYCGAFTFHLNRQWGNEKAVGAEQITVRVSPIGRAKSMREGHIPFELQSSQIRPPTNGQHQEEGPSIQRLSAWTTPTSDLQLESGHILNIQPEVFVDKNPASGIYYYMPQSYNLAWEKDTGYQLEILNEGVVDFEQNGTARFQATLTAGIHREETAVLEQLVRSYTLKHQLPFHELRPLPLDSAPVTNLGSNLRLYDIKSEFTGASGGARIQDDLIMSWNARIHAKEEIKTDLISKTGLTGTVTLDIQGDSLSHQQVPFKVALNNPVNNGKMVLKNSGWRKAGMHNTYTYPIQPQHIHALFLVKGTNQITPNVLSWKLDSNIVKPGGHFEFDIQNMPSWIERNAHLFWMTYTVPDCRVCDQDMLMALEGGRVSHGAHSIRFETLNALAEFEAEFLKVDIRSSFARPNSSIPAFLESIRLRKDEEIKEAGPLFFPNGLPASGQTLFEYKLTLYTADGRRYLSRWIQGKELEITLIPQDFRDHLGDLKDAG